MKTINILFFCLLNVLNISATVYKGTCGDNANYSLDTETGVLSIAGTGVTNYGSKPWYSRRSYVKTVVIVNGITMIGSGAFSGCSNLISVTIPNSVTYIDETAFYNCSGLTSVTIPNSVTSIGDNAFNNCSGLTSVTIPNKVTSIGTSVFRDCSGLTSITIPNSVTSIGESAFSGCSGLTSIVIPNSVTNIGWGAFSDCSGLTSIEIPNNVTRIGERAFINCSGLTSVSIGDGVATIEGIAFSGCSKLTSVSIGAGVTSIGYNAFNNCSSLTSVDIKDIAAWCNINFSSSSSNPLYYAHHLFLNGNEIKEMTIPGNVTSIGYIAFYGCLGLTSVTIPSSVTSMGSYAFSNCSSLKKMKVYKTAPINITSDVFNNTSKSVLYIPKGSKTSYASANIWKEFKTIKEFPDCDVNWDGEKDVIDVVDIARFVVGTPRAVFDDYLADMNNSGSINVADAVVLVNEIAGDTQFARSAMRVPYHNNDVLSLCHNNEDRLSMQLEGAERYTAFQFDLWLPSDMNLTVLSLNNLRSQGHQLLYNKVEDGHYRVVVLSTSRETFNGTSGELLSMMLDGFASDDIRIDNIHFVTNQGYDVPFDAVNAKYAGIVTDIQNVEPAKVEKRTEKQAIYNLNGQRLMSPRKGLNIVGGKKIIVK